MHEKNTPTPTPTAEQQTGMTGLIYGPVRQRGDRVPISPGMETGDTTFDSSVRADFVMTYDPVTGDVGMVRYDQSVHGDNLRTVVGWVYDKGIRQAERVMLELGEGELATLAQKLGHTGKARRVVEVGDQNELQRLKHALAKLQTGGFGSEAEQQRLVAAIQAKINALKMKKTDLD